MTPWVPCLEMGRLKLLPPHRVKMGRGGLWVKMPSLAYKYHVVGFSSYEMTVARCHELQYGCTNARNVYYCCD